MITTRYAPIALAISLVFVADGCGAAKNRAAATSQKTSVVKNAPWKEFSPKGGRFSLLMPGVPTEKVSIDDTVVGPLESHSFLLKAVQGDYKAGYLFSYADYPQEKRGVLSDAEFLESFYVAFQEKYDGDVIYKKKIKFENYEGIEYKCTSKIQPSNIVMCRDYLIGSRLLTLSAVMPKKQFERGDAMKYLDSLKLTR